MVYVYTRYTVQSSLVHMCAYTTQIRIHSHVINAENETARAATTTMSARSHDVSVTR